MRSLVRRRAAGGEGSFGGVSSATGKSANNRAYGGRNWEERRGLGGGAPRILDPLGFGQELAHRGANSGPRHVVNGGAHDKNVDAGAYESLEVVNVDPAFGDRRCGRFHRL